MKQKHSSFNRMKKWIMAYICMPLIFVAIGTGVLYLCCKPVLQHQRNTASMLFNSGNAYFLGDIQPVLSELTRAPVVQEPFEGEKQIVEEPNIGDQYGQLVCERLGIYAPVYFGDNKDVLSNGIGTYPVSWIPGCGRTTLMSGHNDMALSVLADVQIGDEFVLTTDYGTFKYSVSEFTIVDEDEIEACRLDEEKEQVVIYTCYPFYKISGRREERFFVYLNKISGPEITLTNYFLKD